MSLSIEKLFFVASDTFYFLCAVPVVTIMSLAGMFSLCEIYTKCYKTLIVLKAKQTEEAKPWLVQNHIICKNTCVYEKLFCENFPTEK